MRKKGPFRWGMASLPESAVASTCLLEKSQQKIILTFKSKDGGRFIVSQSGESVEAAGIRQISFLCFGWKETSNLTSYTVRFQKSSKAV